MDSVGAQKNVTKAETIESVAGRIDTSLQIIFLLSTVFRMDGKTTTT